MNKKDIVDAWAWVRKNNQAIPDDVLDLMKDAAIEKLDSHTPEVKRDWEIESYITDDLGWAGEIFIRSSYDEFKTVVPQRWNTLKEAALIHNKASIHSVRRLSDNSVWVVGEDTPDGKIESFEQYNECHIKVNLVGNKYLWFHTLCKLPQRTKLFTTEDGSDIFNNTPLWIVFSTCEMKYGVVCADGRQQVMQFLYKPENNKYFFSEEKAKEYILMNKPCLSVNDIMDISNKIPYSCIGGHSFQLDKLKELAKQKLYKQ